MERKLARKLGYTKISINNFKPIDIDDELINFIDEEWDIVDMITYWYDDFINLESIDSVSPEIWNRDINQCNAYVHNILMDLSTSQKAYEFEDSARDLYFLFCENKEMNCGYLFIFSAKGYEEN